MNFLQKSWKGILVCLVMAVPCWLLGQKFPIVGGPVFGILAGMIVTLLWRDKTAAQPGISFVSKKVLQYAVILLGFGMNLSVILQTGKQSLPIILVTITTSLVIAWALHKLLHIPGKISTLIGVGSSICGGSAIAATAPVIDADDEEWVVYGPFDQFAALQKYFEDNGFELVSAEFERIPTDYKEVTPEQRESVQKLLDKFDDDEDVQNVFHNMKEEDE